MTVYESLVESINKDEPDAYSKIYQAHVEGKIEYFQFINLMTVLYW